MSSKKKVLETKHINEFCPEIEFYNNYLLQNTKPKFNWAIPQPCNEVIWEDTDYVIRKLWTWGVHDVYSEGNIICGRIYPDKEHYYTIILATLDGKYSSTIPFYHAKFERNGLIRFVVYSEYGYLDQNLKIAIPPVYSRAEDFHGGRAVVMRDGEYLLIDNKGKEYELENTTGIPYEDVTFQDGICRVATMDLKLYELAYYSDYEDICGWYGYLDANGKELVKPQYIIAEEFCDGCAIVCKGKWELRDNWPRKEGHPCYWSEEFLWGVIDKTGKEIVPCKFGEIRRFWDSNNEYFIVQDEETGNCGIIDAKGNWIVEPIWEDINYEISNGRIEFTENSGMLDGPAGVYDINKRKVVLSAKYWDIDFFDDGRILAHELVDKDHTNAIFFDDDGNELRRYKNAKIRHHGNLCTITQNGLQGILDENGETLLPCKYNLPFQWFKGKNDYILVGEFGKQGVIDIQGNEIIPPTYDELFAIHKPYITSSKGTPGDRRKGLITHKNEEILPMKYLNVYWLENKDFLICKSEDGCEGYVVERKH